MLKAKKTLIISFIILFVISALCLERIILANNRETLPDPEPMVFEEITFDDEEYELLYENSKLAYRYHPRTDCFVIKDKRNGYTWKSGIDSLTRSALEDLAIMSENKKEDLVPAPTMTDTYVERANSTLTVQYYDTALNLKNTSSSNKQVSKSYKKASGKNTYSFSYSFSKIDIKIVVLISFDEKGMNVSIPDENITGEGQSSLANIEIFPFLGATGGEFVSYDFNDEYNGYDNEDLIFRSEMIDGYSIIPDGSGALLRFKSNTQEFSEIELPVYGVNASHAGTNYSVEQPYIEEKNASMPMFGMVHGYNQNAFLAYANSGDPYMSIVSVPFGLNNVCYNWTYAKFKYNFKYYQIYNQAGQGNYKLMKERNHFDISLNYQFLQGSKEESNLSADYIGVANAYKEVINNSFTSQKAKASSIPMRVDFIMSDTAPSVVGRENVVVTNTDDVRRILNELGSIGVNNINSGLLGYQDGGITFGLKNKVKYVSEIGSKKDYKKLISEFNEKGIDISLAEDYYFINDIMYNLSGKATKHYNGWYDGYLDNTLGYIGYLNILKPSVAKTYANKQIKSIIKDLKPASLTISGISDHILSHYEESLTDGITAYEDIFKANSEKALINATKPNSYLWPYVTRYLQANAFNSQYLNETDSIPLISFILHDYMEVYATYANFSFYDTQSILRMIDYNLLPSFIISSKSSHLLVNTNSNKYYSTEYDLYKERMENIYKAINSTLGSVYNEKWLDRDVLASGIIKNYYSNNKCVIINYTEADYVYNGQVVKKMSSVVMSNA